MTPTEIKWMREVLGLTQQQVADRVGSQRHSVSRWETGDSRPRGAYLKLLKELAEKAKRKAKGRK